MYLKFGDKYINEYLKLGEKTHFNILGDGNEIEIRRDGKNLSVEKYMDKMYRIVYSSEKCVTFDRNLISNLKYKMTMCGDILVLTTNDVQQVLPEYTILDNNIIGKGRFGYVYGNPRLLCEDETVPTYTEVTKIYKSNYYTENEIIDKYNIIKKLDEDANKYMLLPKKLCKLEINDREFINLQIIFDMGYNNRYFSQLNNELFSKGQIFEIFEPYRNLLEGILYLRKKKMIHSDIKLNNIVLHDNKIKMIDLDTLNYYGVSKKSYTNLKIFEFIFSNQITIIYLNNYNIENNSTYDSFINNFIHYLSSRYNKKIMDFLLNELSITNLTNFRKIYDENLTKFGRDDTINDLYDRFDLYSLGIIMIEVINKLNDNYQAYMLYIICENIIPFIKLCCVSNERAPSDNDLLNAYDNFLKSIM